MSGEGLDPLKRMIVKGLASGIGLASESITSYKERRRAESPTSNTEICHVRNKETSKIDASTEAPAQEVQVQASEDAQWELDEAQDELCNVDDSPSHHQEIGDATNLGQGLIDRHPLPPYPGTGARLPRPVILPQRRPKTRKRGFIRAYAPALNDVGIDQEMFLDFLETFHTSTQASPWLDAINLASMGLSLIPHFPMAVGIAIQVSIMAAKSVQNRTRTNAYLNKANDEFFRPRGLYCLIMTYSPDADESHEKTDVFSTIATSLNPSTSQKLYGRFRESSGKTFGEVELPEAAPLVFPVLDQTVIEGDQPKSRKAKVEGAQDYVREYFDKRAQAKFVSKNAGSALIQGPAPKFTSRYADPNHPASSGSFRSLVTGGYINPPSMSHQQRLAGVVNSWCANWDGRQPTGHYTLKDHVLRTGWMLSGGSSRAEHAPFGTQKPDLCARDAGLGGMSRRGADRDNIQIGPLSIPTAGTVVKKALKKNILYLMIVNMPSDEELAQAAEEIERRRSEGIKMLSILKRFQY